MLPFLRLCSFYKQQPKQVTCVESADPRSAFWSYLYKSLAKFIFLLKILPRLWFVTVTHSGWTRRCSDYRLGFGWRLQFPWQRSEDEVELVVAIWLVDGSSAASPQQPQLEVRLKYLQQLLVTLKLWGREKRGNKAAERRQRTNAGRFLPCRIFSAFLV